MRKLPHIAYAPTDASRGSATADSVAEIVTFRLAEGVTYDTFLTAANGIEPFLQSTGAVISRTLSVDDDGLWTDYIVWTSMEAAKNTADALMARPEAMPMMAAIAEGSAMMRYAPILLTMD